MVLCVCKGVAKWLLFLLCGLYAIARVFWMVNRCLFWLCHDVLSDHWFLGCPGLLPSGCYGVFGGYYVVIMWFWLVARTLLECS